MVAPVVVMPDTDSNKASEIEIPQITNGIEEKTEIIIQLYVVIKRISFPAGLVKAPIFIKKTPKNSVIKNEPRKYTSCLSIRQPATKTININTESMISAIPFIKKADFINQ